MRYPITITLILLFVFDIPAQNGANLTARILDASTKQALPFVSAAVYTLQNDLLAGNITDSEGRFIIRGLVPGSHRLDLSFVGYETISMQILIGKLNENYDLGSIELHESPTKLEEVIVKGLRSEISSDLNTRSYSLENSIAQSGGTVMDALMSVPGVSFDQEGKLILRGSDRVIVLVDGKQSSLTGIGTQRSLDNIPAGNIERIEIINNPSAKYDANGMAGVVNLIFKKEQHDGWHATAGMAYGLGVLSKKKDDLPSELGSYSRTPKYIPSLDLNFRHKKTSFYLLSEILSQKRLPNNEFTTRSYDDGRIIASQVPENRSQIHYIFNSGLDYQLNDFDKISLTGLYDWESHRDSAQVPYLFFPSGIRNRFITWKEKEITGYANYSLNFEHQFRQSGHKYNASLQYSKGWEDESYFLNDSSFVRVNGRDITTVLGTEHTTSVLFDYVKPNSSGRLETGAKLQIRRLPVKYEQQRGNFSMLYPGLGNWSRWGESIYAGYVNLVREKPSYSVEAGIRMEYSSVFYEMDPENIYYPDNDKYHYLRFFPNVRLGLLLNEYQKISLFYNERIDRPAEPELRIFSKSDDHELVKVGNPYLRPQYTRNTEIAFHQFWSTGSFFISAYYKRISDSFSRIYTRDPGSIYDIVVKSYANTGLNNNLGTEIIISQRISNYWKLNTSLNYYKNKISTYSGNLYFPFSQEFNIKESKNPAWNTKLNSTWDLSGELQIQLAAMFYSSQNIPQGRQLSRNSIDLGIKKKWNNGNTELSISFSDIFNRFGLRQIINGDEFSAAYENYYETQILRCAVKFKL